MDRKTFVGIAGILVLIAVATFVVFGGQPSLSPSPSNSSLNVTKSLSIGTTNIVKTDNFVKDYYMGIFAACFILDPLAAVDEGGNIVPYLVNWSTTDSKDWTLTLIRNATWHDGVPVTANDVAFTITYLKEKDPNYATHFQFVVSAEPVDNKTVIVRLSKEWTSFTIGLAATRLMPKHIWYNVTDPATYSGSNRNVGCGPFIYGGFDSASGTMTFRANKGYWRGSPAVDTVTIKFYASTDSMLMALKKGDIAATYAYASGIDPIYVPPLLEEKNVSFMILPNFGVDNSIWFNSMRYPYNLVDFRNAISYALDYSAYITYIASGYAKVPTKGWIPDSWDYYVQKPQLVKNASLAASMLDSLGFIDYDSDGWRDYPNGTAFTMKVLARSDIALSMRLAELVKRDLESIRIRVQVIPADVSTFQTITQNTKDFDSAISRTTFWGMIMYAGAGTLYFDNRNMGWANVDDLEYHEVVDELLRTSNQTRTRELYEALQELYATKMYAIPLYWGKIIQPYRSDMVDGLVYNTMYGILGKDTWFSIILK
ncbi:MAG: ABC transporter substrate-binding protein [Candidatus Verstraetearchaeota archaeon]|nr:ABC transporter substrate-binding protein [Candidatus Verstraetearchaeota archaeon]